MEILLAKEIYLLVTSSCCDVEGAMQYGDFTWTTVIISLGLLIFQSKFPLGGDKIEIEITKKIQTTLKILPYLSHAPTPSH